MFPQANLRRGSFKYGVLKIQKRWSCHGAISALRSRGSYFRAILPALCPRQNPLHSGNILLSDKAGLLFKYPQISKYPHILLGHRMPGKDFTFPRRTPLWDQTHWGPKSALPITTASDPGWATGLSHCTLRCLPSQTVSELQKQNKIPPGFL